MTPLFSIGVTTYDREDLLRETVQSILAQRYENFEVIIGNDNPRRLVTREFLGVQDSRIRIVNHRQNLGEHANMNDLLHHAQGQYFTWMADDDLYAPTFLLAVQAALQHFGNPPCVFTAFAGGQAFDCSHWATDWSMAEHSGRQFLERYLSREIRVAGSLGVFTRKALTGLGGMRRLGRGFSPYSDNLLALQCGLLDRVVHIDAPLVFYRAHEHSPSHSSTDVLAFFTAQQDLMREAKRIFSDGTLYHKSSLYAYLLMRWCLRDIASVIRRGRGSKAGQLISFWSATLRHLVLLRNAFSVLQGLMVAIRLSGWLLASAPKRA